MPKIRRGTIVQTLNTISIFRFSTFWLAIVWLVFGASAPTALADGIISSDFVFQLDNSVFKTPDYAFKNLLTAPAVIDLPDQVIQDQAPVNVTGIQAELKYDFETSTEYPVLGAETAIASKSISGRLKLAKIDVDSDIVINDGGATAIGHLKATCTNVVVTLTPGKAKALGSIAVVLDNSGQPVIRVPWFQVTWTEDAWQVGDVTCTGARNFSVRAKKSLTDYFKKSASFAPQFKSFIEETAATQQAKIREFLAKPIDLNLGLPRIKAKAYPQKIEAIAGDKFQLRGRLDIAFENGAFNETKTLPMTAAPATQSGFAVALPDGILQAVNEMSYRSGYDSTRKAGSAITSFQTFRDSGLAVSIVWPELGRYPKEMDFIFDFFADEQPQILSAAGDGAGALVGRISASMQTKVWAQKFALPIQYGVFGTFRTPIQAQYKLSFVPDGNGSSLQVAFQSIDTDLKYVWDPSYKPESSSVDVERLSSEIRDGLIKDPLSFSIRAFPLTESLQLRASGLRRSSGWLYLDFMK